MEIVNSSRCFLRFEVKASSMTIWLKAAEAQSYLEEVDPVMREIISEIGPCSIRPLKGQSLFHSLSRSIVYQQLSGRAASTIFSRLKALYPDKAFFSPDDILRTSDHKLRKAGLSRAKTLAIKDLSRKTLEGVVPTPQKIRHLSDEEIVQRLTQIRGVGDWTVEMLLIFRLGRLDVLPVHDLGIRKGYAKSYLGDVTLLPPPKELHRLGEKWKPFRSVASWYLWRSLEISQT